MRDDFKKEQEKTAEMGKALAREWDTLPDEAQRILQLLHKFSGNREKTARELGVSKATLWRHMKKYDIT